MIIEPHLLSNKNGFPFDEIIRNEDKKIRMKGNYASLIELLLFINIDYLSNKISAINNLV